MRKFIFAISSVIFFSGCVAQKKQPLACNGFDILALNPSIQGLGPCGRCDISVSAFINGFKIVLSDSSYQIIGFTLSYAQNGNILFENEIAGNEATNRNTQSLKLLSEGGFIVIDCINVRKNNIRALSTGMTIGLTK